MLFSCLQHDGISSPAERSECTGEVSAEDGASRTAGGVQAVASLLSASCPAPGSGPTPCTGAVDGACQLRVGQGEPDWHCESSGQTGSAGPAETAAAAGKLRYPAPAAGNTGTETGGDSDGQLLLPEPSNQTPPAATASSMTTSSTVS